MAEKTLSQLRAEVAKTYHTARKDGTLTKLRRIVMALGERDESGFTYRYSVGKTTLSFDPRTNAYTVISDGDKVLSSARGNQYLKSGPWLKTLIGKLPEAEKLEAENEADERKSLEAILDAGKTAPAEPKGA